MDCIRADLKGKHCHGHYKHKNNQCLVHLWFKKKKKKVTKNSKVYVTSQHYANPFSEHICLQLRLLDEKASSGSLIQYFTHR